MLWSGFPNKKQLRSTGKRFALSFERLEHRIAPAVFTVDDDMMQIPQAEFNLIQDAIDAAAPGDTIRVAEGLYMEALRIAGAGKDGLIIESFDDAAPKPRILGAQVEGSIISIEGASDVTLDNFEIDGNGNPSSLIDSAIRVVGAGSATIRNVEIFGLFNGTGDQTGFGIRVGQFNQQGGDFGTALIESSTIRDYQKGGILVSEPGSSATIRGNTVTGAGLTDAVSQNGIEVSFGATAEVEDNVVRSNQFDGADVTGGGIFVFETSDVAVRRNQFETNQTGVLVQESVNNEITENAVRNNTNDGIWLLDSDDNRVAENETTGNGFGGILVLRSSNNELVENISRDNDLEGIAVVESDENILSENEVSDNALDGIRILDSDSNDLIENVVEGNGGDGISLENADETVLLANLVSGSGGEDVSIDPDSQGSTVLEEKPFHVVGAGAGAEPVIRVFDNETFEEQFSFFAFELGYTGGVRVALADVNDDGLAEILAASGGGRLAEVRIFRGDDGTLLDAFNPFVGFFGAIEVDSGDVNNDGFDDIIVGADDMGGNGHVKVFDGEDNGLMQSFFAFTDYTAGVRVTGGDTNNDGFADLVVAASLAPHIKVFDGSSIAPIEMESFFAFNPLMVPAGLFVGAGDVDGDGFADIIAGLDAFLPALVNDIGPRIKVFSGATTELELADTLAFDQAFAGGARVSGIDIGFDGELEVLVGAGPGAEANVRIFDPLAAPDIGNFFAFDDFAGGVFVAG